MHWLLDWCRQLRALPLKVESLRAARALLPGSATLENGWRGLVVASPRPGLEPIRFVGQKGVLSHVEIRFASEGARPRPEEIEALFGAGRPLSPASEDHGGERLAYDAVGEGGKVLVIYTGARRGLEASADTFSDLDLRPVIPAPAAANDHPGTPMTPQQLVSWGYRLSGRFAKEAEGYYFKDSGYDSNQSFSDTCAEKAKEIQEALKLPGMLAPLSAVPALAAAGIPAEASSNDQWRTFDSLCSALWPTIARGRQLRWVFDWCVKLHALPPGARNIEAARTLLPDGAVLEEGEDAVTVAAPRPGLEPIRFAGLYGRFGHVDIRFVSEDARPRRDALEAVFGVGRPSVTPPDDFTHERWSYASPGTGKEEVEVLVRVERSGPFAGTVAEICLTFYHPDAPPEPVVPPVNFAPSGPSKLTILGRTMGGCLLLVFVAGAIAAFVEGGVRSGGIYLLGLLVCAVGGYVRYWIFHPKAPE